jgi:hypothetical protein
VPQNKVVKETLSYVYILPSGVKTINVRENREEQSRMDKPETLVTLDTQNTGDSFTALLRK